MTGNTILGPDLSAKRVQILKELLPFVSRAAFLWNPDNASNALIPQEYQAAMPKLGMSLILVPVRNTSEFDPAFAAVLREHADALLMTNDPFHQRHIQKILAFLAENRIPGCSKLRKMSWQGVSCPTARACLTCFGAAHHTYTRCYRARDLRIFLWSNQRNSS
jgi:putative tryptophan/tyrosine transport system substrate-binding protein